MGLHDPFANGQTQAGPTDLFGALEPEKFIEYSIQVLPGDSGPLVRDLDVGLGVSDQIQHMTGVRGAKVVCAVNRDENAPIFALSDCRIGGSLYEVVPKIIAELKK